MLKGVIETDIDTNNLNVDEYNFISSNFDRFQYIFDAAAIGQYLGGIDPIHDKNDTSGFVNEICIINPFRTVF